MKINQISIIYSFKATVYVLLALIVVLSSCEPKEIDQDDKDLEIEDDSTIYLSKVFEYVYAPGQHASIAKPSDTINIMGNPAKHSGWLYLGGFGGYVIAGFSENIPNVDGYDFEVFALKGASPEPAVVYVMKDENGDNLPNDTWYEFKGSQFAESIRDFELTYYKATSDSSDIAWRDVSGNEGVLHSGYGSAYTSGWWWQYTLTNEIKFKGTRLPDAYENNPVNGTAHWTVPENRFEWGYAENNSGQDYDTSKGSNLFDISNAVDETGNFIHLDNIRFIKIQSAVFQQAGWLNEISPEIRGAAGLRKKK